VDVAYSGREGVGAYVLVDAATQQPLWSTTIRLPVSFPYITGYLAFREIPIHLELLEQAREHDALAPLLMMDGSGVLHPRRAGIAAHLGVLADCPTIGVSKKLLCGEIGRDAVHAGRPSPILHQGDLWGMAVRATPASRPIFVSPGHRIRVPDAARVVMQTFRSHRLPEPIHLADALSRRAAKELKVEG
jgi:deoxyribonuclease V